MNLALGVEVNQTVNTINVTNNHKEKLRRLSVEENDVNELSKIVENPEFSKPEKQKLLLSWLGKYQHQLQLEDYIKTSLLNRFRPEFNLKIANWQQLF